MFHLMICIVKSDNKICYCYCHVYPGVYINEPCHHCGHYNSDGKMVAGIRDGWTKNKKELNNENKFYKSK